MYRAPSRIFPRSNPLWAGPRGGIGDLNFTHGSSHSRDKQRKTRQLPRNGVPTSLCGPPKHDGSYSHPVLEITSRGPNRLPVVDGALHFGLLRSSVGAQSLNVSLRRNEGASESVFGGSTFSVAHTSGVHTRLRQQCQSSTYSSHARSTEVNFCPAILAVQPSGLHTGRSGCSNGHLVYGGASVINIGGPDYYDASRRHGQVGRFMRLWTGRNVA